MNIIPPLLTALLALVIFFAVHVVMWRAVQPKGLMILVAIAAGSFAIAAMVMMTAGVISADVWVGLCVYLFCILAYLHFYVGTCRALSARILEELMHANGAMTLEELDRVYPLQWIYASRLRLLVEHGWLIEESGLFRTTPKARFFARIIVALRRVYGITRAG
ncbi:MAG TPA: hypothetical protein VHA78_00450 [Candidatus Peribacteraceae bacterium]|nr:hypothetical protein [Candidatus Peribacteraceae bacterium]